MRSEWGKVPLKDLAIINRDNYTVKDDWCYVNYLATSNITKGIINYIAYLDLKHDKLPSRARRKVESNDIVYSMVRPNQEHYGIIRNPVSNMLVSTGFVTITAKGDINVPYLYYFISQSQITSYLQAIAEQRVSTYPALNATDIGNLEVVVPPLPTQKAIADTLSCLDAKIEVNNKIIKNLEKQAQAIFKSWFVDFEPFRDGKFVESELGPIPEGWQVEKLKNVVDVKYGKDQRALADGGIPVYGSGGIMRYANKALYTEETVLIPRKGTLNNIMLINHPFWSVDTMFYTKFKLPNFAKFLYLLLLTKDLASMNVGTAVPSMTIALLNEMEFVLPSNKVLKDFEKIVGALYLKIQSNDIQNTTLAALRDTLLPKLMNGEIEVPVE